MCSGGTRALRTGCNPIPGNAPTVRKRRSGRHARRDVGEVFIDLETLRLALFRVKLGGETVAATYCRRERATVITLREHERWIGWDTVETVHKINIFA